MNWAESGGTKSGVGVGEQSRGKPRHDVLCYESVLAETEQKLGWRGRGGACRSLWEGQ